MYRTLNKVMLIGNVGKEPELKFTPSGIPVVSFRLATTEVWKDKDGKMQEHTDWHTIIAWRGLAEVINKIVNKGSRIYVEGRIQTRTFGDKNGTKRYVVEILADNMLMLDQKKLKDEADDNIIYNSPDEGEEFDIDEFSDSPLFVEGLSDNLSSIDEGPFNI